MGDLPQQRKNSHLSKNICDMLKDSCKTLVGYLTIPLSITLIILQECVAWLRQRKNPSDKSLEGKVVLITGANSGIGESLAKYFHQAGCKLILAARRKNELERVKNELVKMKTNKKMYTPSILQLDLSDMKSIPSKAKAAIGINGSIDILVNNAGIYSRGAIMETIMEVDEEIMNVNYLGTLSLTKEIGNHMLKLKTGHIVFISSVLGKFSPPFTAAYSASKHAMQALADGLRAEVKAAGIKVTLISPSYVQTPIAMNSLTAKGQKSGESWKEFESGYTPDYVAERTLKAVVNEESDVVIAPVMDKLVMYIRQMFPNLFFFMMNKYAGSVKKEK